MPKVAATMKAITPPTRTNSAIGCAQYST